jgi:hypothetical protein
MALSDGRGIEDEQRPVWLRDAKHVRKTGKGPGEQAV